MSINFSEVSLTKILNNAEKIMKEWIETAKGVGIIFQLPNVNLLIPNLDKPEMINFNSQIFI